MPASQAAQCASLPCHASFTAPSDPLCCVATCFLFFVHKADILPPPTRSFSLFVTGPTHKLFFPGKCCAVRSYDHLLTDTKKWRNLTTLPRSILVRTLFSSNSSIETSPSELIPRSISFTTWTHLPFTRVIPVDSSQRKWVDDRDPPLRPFHPAPSSGEAFFKDSPVSSVVHPEEALLFHDVPNIQTHFVGPSLLRSRAHREEFPWSAILFASRSTSTGC
ncbi:hypothetical protein SESBI_40822 [Sesbania bispinosa]|nr:hypothetical protein SESBI_40822 [Sesbania bispinosa]